MSKVDLRKPIKGLSNFDISNFAKGAGETAVYSVGMGAVFTGLVSLGAVLLKTPLSSILGVGGIAYTAASSYGSAIGFSFQNNSLFLSKKEQNLRKKGAKVAAAFLFAASVAGTVGCIKIANQEADKQAAIDKANSISVDMTASVDFNKVKNTYTITDVPDIPKGATVKLELSK